MWFGSGYNKNGEMVVTGPYIGQIEAERDMMKNWLLSQTRLHQLPVRTRDDARQLLMRRAADAQHQHEQQQQQPDFLDRAWQGLKNRFSRRATPPETSDLEDDDAPY